MTVRDKFRGSSDQVGDLIDMKHVQLQFYHVYQWNPNFTESPLMSYERESSPLTVTRDRYALDLGDAHMLNVVGRNSDYTPLSSTARLPVSLAQSYGTPERS